MNRSQLCSETIINTGVFQGLDLKRFAPDLIVIETWNQEQTTQYLTQFGYHHIKRYEPLDKGNMYFSRTPEPTHN